MNLAKLSSNGQITIPIEIRRLLDLKSGDKILFFQKIILVNEIHSEFLEKVIILLYTLYFSFLHNTIQFNDIPNE